MPVALDHTETNDMGLPFFKRRRSSSPPSLAVPPCKLSDDVIAEILLMVPLEVHVRCLGSSKLLNEIGNMQWLWYARFVSEFGSADMPNGQSIDWKDEFKKRWISCPWPSREVSPIQLESVDQHAYDADFDGDLHAVAACADGSLRVWSLDDASRREPNFWMPQPRDALWCCAVRKNKIVAGSSGGNALTLDLTSHHFASTTVFTTYEEGVVKTIFCPFGIVFAGSKGSLSVMLPHREVREFYGAHRAVINGMAWCPKSNVLVTAGGAARIKVWRWSPHNKSLQCRNKFTANCSEIACMTVYDSCVLIGGTSGLQEYDIKTGQLLRSFVGHTDFVRAVDTDGKYLVSGAYDSTVRLWDLATAKELHTIGPNEVKSSWVLSVRIKKRQVLFVAGSQCRLLRFTHQINPI